MDTRLPIATAAAGVIGVFIGTLLAPSAPDEAEIAELVRVQMAEAEAAAPADPLAGELAALRQRTEDRLAAIEAREDPRIDALDAALGTLRGQTEELRRQALESTTRAGGALEALHGRIEEIAARAGSDPDLADRVAALAGEIAQMRGAMAPGAAASPQLSDPLPAAAVPPPARIPDAAGLVSPGSTLLLADGGLRVFVSRVTAEGARLFLQGEMVTLPVGGSLTVPAGRDHCRLTLEGATPGGARLTTACGADLPAPQGLPPGRTALFEDGRLRVFVSRVEDRPPRARLWIDSRMHDLAPGRLALLGSAGDRCGVRLESVDRGHATISATCGAALAVSEPVGPGSSVSLGDDAARVFLSALSGDGRARVQVAGLEGLHDLGPGDRLELGEGCGLVLEGIEPGGAVFGYGCDS
ncbi:hypothetical protein [Mangrovicoccus algicola]|uniref:Uncharacterized protein n=1 Tax=Mangrovicoccus algicola TaxID=2771008 RepID=A0A8J7CIR0_9RHOB|nr:hypothetical protein [Mangrovicoccus algicola]MBE3639900.1 hypothetical protein [Mangrovicoccus algicola]